MKEYSMNSSKGIFSKKSVNMNAKRVEPLSGPIMGASANPDQMKVRQLRKKAYNERDSLRGKNGI